MKTDIVLLGIILISAGFAIKHGETFLATPFIVAGIFFIVVVFLHFAIHGVKEDDR